MKENLKKFIAFTVLVLAVILITQMTVLADTNTATQDCSTNKAETIAIKTQDGTTAEITTITFPAGAPSAEVIAPYNNSNGVDLPQLFETRPVATLVSATTYNLWASVTEVSGWDAAVATENIFCSDSATTTNDAFDSGKYALSTWGTVTDMGTQTVSTSFKHLYLTIDLEAAAGKTGQSTIEVYGES